MKLKYTRNNIEGLKVKASTHDSYPMNIVYTIDGFIGDNVLIKWEEPNGKKENMSYSVYAVLKYLNTGEWFEYKDEPSVQPTPAPKNLQTIHIVGYFGAIHQETRNRFWYFKGRDDAKDQYNEMFNDVKLMNEGKTSLYSCEIQLEFKDDEELDQKVKVVIETLKLDKI